MNLDDVKVLVNFRMNQADECLEDARTLFAMEKGYGRDG